MDLTRGKVELISEYLDTLKEALVDWEDLIYIIVRYNPDLEEGKGYLSTVAIPFKCDVADDELRYYKASCLAKAIVNVMTGRYKKYQWVDDATQYLATVVTEVTETNPSADFEMLSKIDYKDLPSNGKELEDYIAKYLREEGVRWYRYDE